MSQPKKVMIVEDDPLNMELLKELLSEADYPIATAHDGESALEQLRADPEGYDAILLDRMMPGIDGLEVMARMKKHDRLQYIPVIFQTAKASRSDVLEGLEAGAHCYITKPFEEANLLAIVQTAVTEHTHHREMQAHIRQTQGALALMQRGEFTFHSLQEAKDLASLLAGVCPDPDRVAIGLAELMINAVEHGNLNIGYQEKSALNEKGNWLNEVNRRLSLAENSDKMVRVWLERTDTEVRIIIQDQGEGFDWSDYMEFSPERAFDNHGRGIAMANAVSFDRLEYLEPGNTVRVGVHLPK